MVSGFNSALLLKIYVSFFAVWALLASMSRHYIVSQILLLAWRISSQKQQSGIWTGWPGRWWSNSPWGCLREGWIWYFGTQFSGWYSWRGRWLDQMIWEVFSNLADSVILWLSTLGQTSPTLSASFYGSIVPALWSFLWMSSGPSWSPRS